jgi:hypothetical protein
MIKSFIRFANQIKEDETDWVRNSLGDRSEIHRKPEGTDCLGNLDANVRIILNYILKKYLSRTTLLQGVSYSFLFNH